MNLAEIQELFQSALLGGDDTILAGLADGPREPKAALLGLYRDAYILRLIEFAENDHELLRAYLGDEAFDAMARAYATAHPSHTRNARYFCSSLPGFLREATPYREHPQLAELAALEKALNDAFDAADAVPLDAAALAAVAVEDWPALTFKPHPSVTRLNLATNAAAIWRALRAGTEPPAPYLLDEPARLIVWRQDQAKFRELNAGEALLWDEAAKGASFAGLCELAATYQAPESAALHTASVLRGWIAAAFLARA